jgi:predicted nucleic acid-binding protein
MPAPFVWIVDSSPFIVLAKVRRLDLLIGDNRRVLVPETVAREVEAGKEGDPARLALAAGWMTAMEGGRRRLSVSA